MRLIPLLLLALLIPVAPAAAATKKGPAGTAFYKPPSKLPGSKHGDTIWARKLSGAAALKSAKSNRLLLYRSTGTNGKPIAVSGTVSIPKGKTPKGGWPVVTYGHGTTGIADTCAPSRDGANGLVSYAYPLLNGWLKAGFAVVRTDYQGLGTPGDHEFLNGREEGRAMLDMVLASRKLDGSLSKSYAIAGHSQGGHAALWAASLAPSWAKGLKLRGTVAFAPASHLGEQAKLLPSIDSPLGNLGAFAAMVLRSIDVTNPQLNVSAGLGDRALALYPQTETLCLADLGKPESFGGLKGTEFFKQGIDPTPVQNAINATDPDELRIRTPIEIEQGASDTTVLPTFTEQLRDGYKQLGNPVTYTSYPGVTHGGVVDAAAKNSTKFLSKRL
jgi:pimeloyl-ACP methyl ester carboxylesterase